MEIGDKRRDDMHKKSNKEPTEKAAPDQKPKGKFKMLGGSQADAWNKRLANLVGAVLPR